MSFVLFIPILSSPLGHLLRAQLFLGVRSCLMQVLLATEVFEHAGK